MSHIMHKTDKCWTNKVAKWQPKDFKVRADRGASEMTEHVS